MIEREELAAWLRLAETPRVGGASARRLLAAFGSPQGIFEAPADGLREIANAAESGALREPPATLAALLAATWDWLNSAPQRSVITLGDPRYPQQLLQTDDPPLMLYVIGEPAWLQRPAIAVVGSRNPTPQGLTNAREFSAAFSRAGLTVVSGLALGVDAAAHEGALGGPGGTIAVVGTGLDRVYPRHHHELAHRIAERGALVSEYALGMPPLAANFPKRNRIIAGLAQGTLVVEAALQSGSLITARMATECGREVFAIPGSIHSPQARGCHALIKQGAKLVETAQDVFEELHFEAAPVPACTPPTATEGSGEDPLLTALGYDPVNLDALVARTGYAPAELSARLLELELAGLVARLPGQLFQRQSPA